MNDAELDCILFDYRGLKFTFRIAPLEKDANGEIIEDIFFSQKDGSTGSGRLNRIMEYGDIIADELALRAPPLPNRVPPAMPVTGAQPTRQHSTGYAAAASADEVCPQCRSGLGPVREPRPGFRVRDCLQQNGQCFRQGTTFPYSVNVSPPGRRN